MSVLAIANNSGQRQYDSSVSGITRSVTETYSLRDDNFNQVRRHTISTRQSTPSRPANQSCCKVAISENKRERLANACCGCGILGAATGGGLILIYLISEYTTVFGNLIDLHVISIPGLTFLVIGLASLLAGIFFCWIYPKRSRPPSSRSRRYRSRFNDELEAGFHLPGYCNQALTHDLPPSYTTVALPGGGGGGYTVRSQDVSSERPPSYVDALKPIKSQEKQVSEDLPSDSIGPQPPPYTDDDTFL